MAMEENPDTALLVIDILKKNPRGLNISEISREIGINRMSVAKYLEVLTARGTIDVRTMGSARLYCLSRRIPVTTFMEYTSKLYLMIDRNLRIVQLNEKLPVAAGLTYEEMIGLNLLDVLRGKVVNFAECESAIYKALAGEVSTVVVENLYKGEHKFFEILHMPIQFPDESPGMMIVSEDITEKKLLEITIREQWEIYRNLVEQGPDIVFSLDPAGCLTYIGPQVAGYGLVPDTLLGKPFGRMVAPADRDAAMSQILAAGSAPGPVRGIRFRALAKNSRNVWLEVNCRARTDASGACSGINGTLRDVTGPANNSPAK